MTAHTLEEWTDAAGVELTTTQVPNNPAPEMTSAEMPGASHWAVHLSRPGERVGLDVVFSMGSAHEGREPDPLEVLECLLSDESIYQECDDAAELAAYFGEEIDDDNADRFAQTFDLMRRQHQQLSSWLGDDELTGVLELERE